MVLKGQGPKVGAQKGGRHETVVWGAQKVGGRTWQRLEHKKGGRQGVEHPRLGGPKEEAQHFALFFSFSRPKFHWVFPSLGIFSWNLGVFFSVSDAREPLTCFFFEFSGPSCVSPGGPRHHQSDGRPLQKEVRRSWWRWRSWRLTFVYLADVTGIVNMLVKNVCNGSECRRQTSSRSVS